MPDQKEIPRLTGFLRTFVTSQPLDIVEEEKKQFTVILKKKKQQKQKAEQRLRENSTGHGLSWKFFLGDNPNDDESVKKIRPVYSQFLNSVMEICGSGISSEELHSASKILYDIFVSKISDTDKKQKLIENFGTILNPDHFNALSEKLSILEEFRQSRLSRPNSSQNLSQTYEDVEFGHHFTLLFEQKCIPQLTLKPTQTEEILQPAKKSTTATQSKPKSNNQQKSSPDQKPTPALKPVVPPKPAIASTSFDNQQNYWQMIEAMPVEGNWLTEQSAAFIESCKGSCPFSAQELTQKIYRELSSNKNPIELQSALFELLGDNSFEFISILLSKRVDILTNIRLGQAASSAPSAAAKRPTPHASSVIIQSEEEKRIEKLRQKELKKQQRKEKQQEKYVDKSEVDETVKALNMKELREKRQKELNTPLTLDNLHDAGTLVDNLLGSHTKLSLPEGTQRIDRRECEEFSIPYEEPHPLEESKLVPITEFEEWAQVAFPKYKTLNRIQSQLFEAAYKTNENLLICAPTGAGKTDCAMMTILHEVGQHVIHGKILSADFKIVYVAPMKALAAEQTQNFARRLNALGLICKELTGDMQLTKKELQETHVIVTTPEKWDVITRKSGDVALTSMVKLLIIDEVHLLHEERGPVLEVLVARTLRQVESTQNMIRIVGLSATLPNYKDVALFLRVNPSSGLFYFDSRYRPVPLAMKFIGAKETNPMRQKIQMNDLCFEKVADSLKQGNQVMVFVHSRKDTVKTAEALREIADLNNMLSLFSCIDHQNWAEGRKLMGKSRNRELASIFEHGFGIHHAGMLRSDRSLVESLFSRGLIKVLCCTATLAWGVNLPAHTVIIKGTQIYDAKHGNFVELGMLDVMQIFGRAGRPQFDTSGEGIIITSHNKLTHYLALLSHQMPIESQFPNALPDHLNAEVTLGTVTNIAEAITWLSYTYLYIRMMRNPMAYGILHRDKELDPQLLNRRRDLITQAALHLDREQMIRFDEKSGIFAGTDLGRVASHYYINHQTVAHFNENLVDSMSEPEILCLLAQSSEFENVMLREEEFPELDELMNSHCVIDVKGGVENKHGKVNILLQAYISHAHIDGFALVSDSAYVVQNSSRILRALFTIVHKRGWASMAAKLLNLCKCIERRLWHTIHPLAQFELFSKEILLKLQYKKLTMDELYDMSARDIGVSINHPQIGSKVKQWVNRLPALDIEVSVQPMTRTVLKVILLISPNFEWHDRTHGSVEPFWIWVEDSQNEHLYHSEYFLLDKKKYLEEEPQKLVFTIPIFEPIPAQYYVHVISDRWLCSETIIPISLKDIVLPDQYQIHTNLLDLHPLPTASLHEEKWAQLYPFKHFNPIQTQVFHTMFHTDTNVLLGAPTGSGKTICAELAMFKIFRDAPKQKVVYIGPLKALVRERLKDWKKKFGEKLGKTVTELTGDYTPNVQALQKSDIVLTTPEKWDGISRNWQSRSYVTSVGLIILDEVHLLGEDRGPILEVIVSRMRYISSQTENPVRFIGLSTALANPRDLADWLGIEKVGLFNFHPSLRPVPIVAHLQGYPGQHYCPRMATMNKPTYQAIQVHSPEKPVLIFVSSRRQTRLTAVDLIALIASEDPKRFLHMSEEELETTVLPRIRDSSLRHTLSFGIGLHHAGLTDGDKEIIEELFGQCRIQVLISTSTLAWGVNLPAHLVIIKGTEFYDPKTKTYVDFPITDVLQMMGRAGRPQFDDEGKAVVMVHEPKKNFYKKFLYEPFPVESYLGHVLPDHLNAEIVAGTITTKQDAIDYLTWTYWFRRLLQNPNYYGLEDSSVSTINQFLSEKVDDVLSELERAGTIVLDDMDVEPTTLGHIASYYYLSHKTMQWFSQTLLPENDIPALLKILCNTTEYGEIPVRHNEDKVNAELAPKLPWKVDARTFDSPHTKTNLLFQAHFCHMTLPMSDYITDQKTVLDSSVRILQSMVDINADAGFLFTTLNTMHLMQTIMQGRWFSDSTLLTLPYFTDYLVNQFAQINVECLPQLMALPKDKLHQVLKPHMSDKKIKEIETILTVYLPTLEMKHRVEKSKSSNEFLVKVELHHKNKLRKEGAWMPLFPKKKDEGCWLVIGDSKSGELFALRRVRFQNQTTKCSLSFETANVSSDLSLYLMWDCYLGLDQQQKIKI